MSDLLPSNMHALAIRRTLDALRGAGIHAELCINPGMSPSICIALRETPLLIEGVKAALVNELQCTQARIVIGTAKGNR